MPSFVSSARCSFVVVLIFLQVVYSVDLLKNDEWGYAPSYGCKGGTNGICGPDEWKTIPGFESCADDGTQSPLDIAVDQVEIAKAEERDFALHMAECYPDIQFQLNEHTAEVNFESSNCEDRHSITFKGKTFTLQQFHFHSPSENLWDGRRFPMEVHFVHKRTDGADTEYVVVAAMIALAGKHHVCKKTRDCAHPLFSDVMAKMPQPPFAQKTNFHSRKDRLSDDNPNPYNFLPERISTDYFIWNGSMTTPPCKPGTGPIHWIMGHELIYVDPGMVTKYRELINANPMNQLATYRNIVSTDNVAAPTMPDWHPASGFSYWNPAWNTSLGCNFRPVQKLNRDHGESRRKVYYVTSSAESILFFFVSAVVGTLVFAVIFFAITGGCNGCCPVGASGRAVRGLDEARLIDHL